MPNIYFLEGKVLFLSYKDYSDLRF